MVMTGPSARSSRGLPAGRTPGEAVSVPQVAVARVFVTSNETNTRHDRRRPGERNPASLSPGTNAARGAPREDLAMIARVVALAFAALAVATPPIRCRHAGAGALV